MPDRSGQQFGDYRLKKRIGKGGFGEVYLAEHVGRGTQVALKLLHASLTQERFITAFQREARVLSQLDHPNIVHLFDYGVEQTTPFVVFEYAENGSLGKRYPLGVTFPFVSIASYTRQIAEALQYAHDRGIMHRDVKPDNMLLGNNGEILLSDFGLATLAPDGHIDPEDPLRFAGTLNHMAPEQFFGQPRPASDQYALAVTVYTWICGEYPFQGTSRMMALRNTSAPPPLLSTKVPDISPEVEQVICKALDRWPANRFSSVLEFAQALEQACKKTIDFFPIPEGIQKTARMWVGEASIHLHAKRYPEVIAACDRALEAKPDFSWAYSVRGLAYYRLHEYTKAIGNYDRAIEIDPRYVQALSNRGLAYHDLKHYQQAISNYDRAIACDPTDVTAHNNRGWTHYHLGNYQQAINDYQRAITLSPRFAKAYINLGHTYYAQKEYEKALASFTQALDIDPKQQAVYFQQGRTFFDLKEYQQSVEAYHQTIELNPQDAMAYLNRGWSYHMLKAYEKALEDFAQALNLKPDDARIYNNRGWTYRAMKEHKLALADFEQASALDAKLTNARNGLEKTYWDLNKHQELITFYNKSIERNPQDAEAYFNRGRAHNLLKKPQALSDFTQALELQPHMLAAYIERGFIYDNRREYKLALADFQQALKISDHHPRIHFGLGHVYFALKENEKSIQAYSQMIELVSRYLTPRHNDSPHLPINMCQRTIIVAGLTIRCKITPRPCLTLSRPSSSVHVGRRPISIAASLTMR
ncbi:hypothetical protein KDH_66110 [Dictyobacter sp. S3.2.2.5]|uniref:Protein kinase domain-containing protein n=1 Tax=Dictyobacter halimunensis TaxID=3026934 RepID=A0ABQ6G569_9CHLR|nr:hypothetical protein KDH_66110 [Dictyobacter sp. S3.2.2.5]